MQDKIHSSRDSPDEISALRQQLAISLKFHHSVTLQKIPLEVAVRVMAEAWDACHPEGYKKDYNCASTALIPEEEVIKSIRESKYFSDY